MADKEDWSHGTSIRHGVILSKLAEVYLLVDNITVSLNKELPQLVGGDKDKPNEPAPPEIWLKRLAEIEWPPGKKNTENEAQDAQFLIQLCDALNQRAYPASGPSIGYTQLVAGSKDRPEDFSLHDPCKDIKRSDLAIIAFPNFGRGIALARGIIFQGLPIAMALCLAFTFWLSFDAASGASLADSYNQAATARGTLEDRYLADSDPKPAPSQQSGTTGQSSGPTPRASAPQQGPGSAPGTQSAKPCDIRFGTTTQALAAPVGGGQNSLSCDQALRQVRYATAVAEAQNARMVFAEWGEAQNLPRWVGEDTGPRTRYGSGGDADEMALRWAAVYLKTLGAIILPTLYGILGALTGQTRATYERIRSQTLMPRHVRLVFVPLLLGCVSGVTVGLLYASTTGDTGDATLVSKGVATIGSVHLSTSAYSFLAGFGAEAVFSALDALSQRVFNPTPNAPVRP